jgi:hypothetical protein
MLRHFERVAAEKTGGSERLTPQTSPP